MSDIKNAITLQYESTFEDDIFNNPKQQTSKLHSSKVDTMIDKSIIFLKISKLWWPYLLE